MAETTEEKKKPRELTARERMIDYIKSVELKLPE